MKFMQASKEHLEKHYADLVGRPFFNGLVQYMSSGPVVPMVWEGDDIVDTGRAIIGATNPLQSAPGTIRADYCIKVTINTITIIIHMVCPIITEELYDSRSRNWTQSRSSRVNLCRL